jgi:hypothetical protein
MPIGVQTQTDALATRPILFVSDGRVRATILPRSVSGAARDLGNTPQTTLRAGTILGRITATGLLVEYKTGPTDGSQNPYGILLDDLRVVDDNGSNQTQPNVRVLLSGDVKASQLLINGAALVGNAAETATRTALRSKFFIFDDE